MDSTTSKALEERYFQWLCTHIDPEFGRDTIRTYDGLFRMLYDREFVWTLDVPNDGNRVQDGLDLRLRFRDHEGLESFVLDKGASVLEVLIGISIRLAFMTEGRPEFWAWQIIENLELQKMRDPLTPRKAREIDEKLDVLIWRQYDRDGVGGFFPLAWPDVTKDQTKIEIWYQMAAYVNEIHEP